MQWTAPKLRMVQWNEFERSNVSKKSGWKFPFKVLKCCWFMAHLTMPMIPCYKCGALLIFWVGVCLHWTFTVRSLPSAIPSLNFVLELRSVCLVSARVHCTAPGTQHLDITSLHKGSQWKKNCTLTFSMDLPTKRSLNDGKISQNFCEWDLFEIIHI